MQKSGKVIIRRYKYGDETQLKKLLHEAALTTIWPVFMATAKREIISQSILIVAAILFVAGVLPLIYRWDFFLISNLDFIGDPFFSLLAFPIAMFILFLGISLGHQIKSWTTHKDLNDISNCYQSNPRCEFWVAEYIGQNLSRRPSKIDLIKPNDQEISRSQNGTIIGSIAVTFKEESDEPFQSVAWLRRMAVTKSARRLGIGSALTDVALDHCAKMNFRAIELITTEHHQAARHLYSSKGFELIETKKRSFGGGLVSFDQHRFRLPTFTLMRSNNAWLKWRVLYLLFVTATQHITSGIVNKFNMICCDKLDRSIDGSG